MSLYSLVTAAILPPLNVLGLALIGLALAGWSLRYRRLGFTLAAIGLLGVWLLCTPFVSATLLWSLELGLPHDPGPLQAIPGGPAAIVILSADAAFAGPGGLDPDSGIGDLTLDRMRAGALLARHTGLPILVTGDALELGAAPIAAQMATSLHDDFGLDTRWVEPKAADTWQNAQFSARMLEADGIHSAYVVTSAWHLRRTLLAFAPTGLKVTPEAAHFARTPRLSLDELIPRATSLRDSYFALHEWIGCLYYAWLR